MAYRQEWDRQIHDTVLDVNVNVWQRVRVQPPTER